MRRTSVVPTTRGETSIVSPSTTRVTLTCWVSVCARAGVMGCPSGPHATHSAKLLAITAAASTCILRNMRGILKQPTASAPPTTWGWGGAASLHHISPLTLGEETGRAENRT